VEPLTCLLPPESIWLEFKVTTSAPSLQVKSELVDARCAKLDFGLFRRDESFAFQGLVQLGQSHAQVKAVDFADTVSWQHRISSLGEVKTVQMPDQPKRSKFVSWTRRVFTVVIFCSYFVMGLLQLMSLGPLDKQPSLIFNVTSEGKTTLVKLFPIANGMTTIKDIKTGETRDVELKEYSRAAVFTPVWTDKRDAGHWGIFFGAFMILASVSFLWIGLSKDYRRFKLTRLISSSCHQA
jgi:hypothetical protein